MIYKTISTNNKLIRISFLLVVKFLSPDTIHTTEFPFYLFASLTEEIHSSTTLKYRWRFLFWVGLVIDVSGLEPGTLLKLD